MGHDFEKDATRVGYQYFTSRRFLPKLRKIYRVMYQCKLGGFSPEAPYLVFYHNNSKQGYMAGMEKPKAFFDRTELGYCFFPLGAFGRLFGMEERTLKKHFRDFVCDFPDELIKNGIDLPSNGTKCIYVSHMMMEQMAQFQEVRNELEKVPVIHKMAKIILS